MPVEIMTSKEIRQTFLDFFKSKGHEIVQSSPIVVKNDPTLMFTNAGMNQFKDIFLGNRQPKAPRAADTQKCLRVSGKHNDLEEVGHDTYHHTMFEMLGNWSFGDYFKKEVIGWAWELLTDVYKIDKDRLYATVFEGYAPDGLGLDEEALTEWKKYLPEDHILKGDRHDNFWEMGDTGPCGPCSEIHVDLRDDAERSKLPGAGLVNKSNPLVIEIWNLVFMQFDRKADGHLENLPHKNIDTGMGFERLCMVLQGVKSNYDTDVFRPMIQTISEMCGKPYVEKSDEGIAMRVIADHIRAITFAIADGQLPSNVKAGYVIRRILRRAVRYGYTFLGFRQPFLCMLVPELVREMGEVFPEIKAQEKLIVEVIRNEEEAFLRTLDKGIGLMDQIMEKDKEGKLISGVDAFTLYDTFGFPIDLSELIAHEHGYEIDIEGFQAELQKQKERARNAASKEEGDWIDVRESVKTVFDGYDMLSEPVHIVKYRTVKTKGREIYQLVFDRTPFYAESGGEVGDTGLLESGSGERISILNTIKENDLPIHVADRIPSDPSDEFNAKVDAERRQKIANNHSCTHLLDFSLRAILGTHIEQKGSFVGPDSFRFDFSHFEKVGDENLKKVERMVNRLIRKNIVKEELRDIPIDEARNYGAIALFGEKYGDKVRLIKFGDSVEFCGGCHTSATGNIGYFKIISESAVAAGVRRIEAVTGEAAESVIDSLEGSYNEVRALFNNVPNVADAARKLMEENAEAKKQLEEAARQKAGQLKEKILSERKVVDGTDVYECSEEIDANAMKEIAFEMYKTLSNSAFFGAFRTPDGKACLTVMYTDDLVKKGRNASNDIRQAAKLIMGGGGGQPFLATAGGKEIEGLSEALKLLESLL
jgi:alanyl-tRNA synthetase